MRFRHDHINPRVSCWLPICFDRHKCHCSKDPIVKLELFYHNSLEYCAYFSSLCPCVIIPMRVMGNSKPIYDLLQTCNLGSAIFLWSILSWIMHRSWFFNCTNYIHQMWYKFLHDSWCKICFLSFPSYSITSSLFLPTFDIKSLRDSQIVHLANTNLHFRTLTFWWCLFLNLLMANWKIPPMLNSLFICNNTIWKQRKFMFAIINAPLYTLKISFQFLVK